MAKRKVVKGRRVVPAGKTGKTITIKTYTIQRRWLDAREKACLKAGYQPGEISRMSNDMEVGLLSFTLTELTKTHVLSGRKNHVKRYTDGGYTRVEAIQRAVEDFEGWGGIYGRLGDYIEYYYGH